MATRRILNERTDNETLRRKCRTVDTVDERIRTLLDDLAQTMYEANGVGLAAGGRAAPRGGGRRVRRKRAV